MKNHTETLWQLVKELFTAEEDSQIRLLTTIEPLSLNVLITFDDTLGGPSVSHLNCGQEGRYEIADRDIFRPLQYCGMYFKAMISQANIDDPLWLTRDIVEMSSLHIEGLIKNIGSMDRLPLGAAMQKRIVKRKVDPATWKQIDTFTHVYNDAKHNFHHEKDTHMFSVEDAVLAYFVCRKLGARLYPLARLATDIKIFDRECDETEKAKMSKWIVDPPEGEMNTVNESAGGWAIK